MINKTNKMNEIKIAVLIVFGLMLQGCFATKIVTVPLNVVGDVISVVPIVGDVAESSIELVADTVDLIPL